MGIKEEVERLKSVYESLKDDKDVKAVFDEAKGLIDSLAKGKDKDIEAKLTGYADVDETVALAFKGAEVRKAYQNRMRAVHLLSNILTLAARYMPVVNEVVKAAKKVRKTAKSASKKSLKRRSKKS